MQVDFAALVARVDELTSKEMFVEAWALLEPLHDELLSSSELAARWLTLSEQATNQDAAERVTAMIAHYSDDWRILSQAGETLAGMAEERPFDEAPLPDGPALIAADALKRSWSLIPHGRKNESETEAWFHAATAMALRMAGSEYDDEALKLMQRAIELVPDDPGLWFKLGLLHKWRGQWRDGVLANQKARDLGNDSQGVLWNLMICATGAGDYEGALALNREMGMKIRAGEDGLPFGGFGGVQVRVSSLGEGIDRAAHALGCAPEFENLWIERRSLCHGMVVSATLNDLCVDYGDLVLFDGAPVGYRTDGETSVPRFPLLQRIRAGAHRRYWFIAQQPRAGAVQLLSDEHRWTFYVHSEQIRMLCRECATDDRGRGAGHSHEETPEAKIVGGKVVIEPGTPLRDVGAAIDDARSRGVHIAVPELFREAGDRARTEQAAELWEKLDRDELVEEAPPPPKSPMTPPTPKKKWWPFP